MADLGYFEISNLKRTIRLDEDSLADWQDVVLGNNVFLRTTHSILCLKDPPHWYNEIIADKGPVDLP